MSMLDHIAASSNTRPGSGPVKKWTLAQKVQQGERNNSATSFIGRLLRKADELDWDTKVWRKVQKWNTEHCVPPLEEGELKTVFESIANTELERRETEGPDADGGNQATEIFNEIVKMPDLVLFVDDFEEPYAQYKLKDHIEVRPCNSVAFKSWLSIESRRIIGKIAESSKIDSVCKMLQAEARYRELEYELSNRVAKVGDVIYYDLVNKSWQAIEIDIRGWKILEQTPIVFRRFKHQAQQVIPIHGGSVAEVLNFVNITNEDQKLLFLVWLVCCYIPGFPHPIMYIFGSQGSAKSTVSWIVRTLVDPSRLHVANLPRKTEEINQMLAHNHLIFIDNISHISQEVSDLLCKAVTGGGISKRQLYTDNDDCIYNVQAKIGINGINLVVDRPDLMERCILFELERVLPENRKEERKLKSEFQSAIPRILGAILTTVSKALAIYPTVETVNLPRMADFAVWGCAVAEALGYTKEQFLDAYSRSMDSQNTAVLEENTEAVLILQFMSDKAIWEGNASELLAGLKNMVGSDKARDLSLVTKPNQLARKINMLKVPLEDAGIALEKHGGKGKVITIRNINIQSIETIETSNSDSSISGVPETLFGGRDDFDDISYPTEDEYDYGA